MVAVETKSETEGVQTILLDLIVDAEKPVSLDQDEIGTALIEMFSKFGIPAVEVSFLDKPQLSTPEEIRKEIVELLSLLPEYETDRGDSL